MEVKPALTAEEWWEIKRRDESGHPPFEAFMAESGVHGKIAWMLHDQPYGFTREDVKRHRAGASHYRAEIKIHTFNFEQLDFTSPSHISAHDLYIETYGELRDWHESMADRIEALLPPEDA